MCMCVREHLPVCVVVCMCACANVAVSGRQTLLSRLRARALWIHARACRCLCVIARACLVVFLQWFRYDAVCVRARARTCSCITPTLHHQLFAGFHHAPGLSEFAERYPEYTEGTVPERPPTTGRGAHSSSASQCGSYTPRSYSQSSVKSPRGHSRGAMWCSVLA